MSDREVEHLMAQVREFLDQEHGRVCDEMGADVFTDLLKVLAEVEAIVTRAEEVAALRAIKGRRMSEASRRRLTDLRDSLGELGALVQAGAAG